MTTPDSGEGTPINDDSTSPADQAGSSGGGFASPTGAPTSGSAPQYGQQTPAFGQSQPQYGAPQGSAPQYGQLSPTNGQSQPQYGQYAPPAAPSNGEQAPQFSQPQYGQQAPQYGQQPQQFGQPQYGAPQNMGHQPFQNFAATNKPGIIPLRPLGLGEVYDGMFGAIRRAPGVVLGLVSVIVAIFVAIAVVIGYVIAPWISSTEFGRAWNTEIGELGDLSGTAELGALSITMLVGLVVPIATIFATAIVVVAIGQLIINRPVRAADVWIKVSGRFWALCGTFLLVSVLPALGYFALILAGIMLGGLANEGVAIGLALIVTLLGALVYFYLQIRWVFAPMVLVLEERKVVDSIKRSGALVKGSFWRVVGYYLLTTLALSTIVGFVGGFAQAILEIFTGSINESWWSLFGYAVIQIATTTITVGALAAVLTLLYVDIRMRREALDLELIAAADTSK